MKLSDAQQWIDGLDFALSDEMFPEGSTLRMNPDIIRDGVRIMRQLNDENDRLRDRVEELKDRLRAALMKPQWDRRQK